MKPFQRLFIQTITVAISFPLQFANGFVAPVSKLLSSCSNDIFPLTMKRESGPVYREPRGHVSEVSLERREYIGLALGRREFLATVVGAASVLALSEDSAALAASKVETSSVVATKSDDSTVGTKNAAAATPKIDTKAIFEKASKKALGGGKAGAAAAVVQVCSLMWLRTAMNYQYRYGGTLSTSLKQLYSDGGIPRLDQGLPFALVQGPLTRFGDTAANVGILALLESLPETSQWPLPLKTAAGSVAAGTWRIFLMPIDTSKTAMQVEGKQGLERLFKRVVGDKTLGPLYSGAFAAAAATAAGHYPWFLTYNALNDALPVVSREDDLLLFLVRSAALGLAASFVSDCVSNSLRVIKTTKQTAGLGSTVGSDDEKDGKDITYREALALVIENDGVVGLFGRGLQTRLLTNAIQGAVFSVLWKYFQATL
mmetsp:Transcript_15834/g.33746  ORF Transcript_15834/g.33746 Transcript_15834/m.33746 type:complete len:428 (+) Transcript_15834:199-1482(+)